MEFDWDDSKYQSNLAKHHLDFRDAWELWEGPHFEWVDARHDYGELRGVVMGQLADWVCVGVYTTRDGRHRIISVRKLRGQQP